MRLREDFLQRFLGGVVGIRPRPEHPLAAANDVRQKRTKSGTSRGSVAVRKPRHFLVELGKIVHAKGSPFDSGLAVSAWTREASDPDSARASGTMYGFRMGIGHRFGERTTAMGATRRSVTRKMRTPVAPELATDFRSRSVRRCPWKETPPK